MCFRKIVYTNIIKFLCKKVFCTFIIEFSHRYKKKEPCGLSFKKKESGNRNRQIASISINCYLKNNCKVVAK